MARKKAISTIESELNAAQEEYEKAKEKCDRLAENIQALKKQKREYESAEIMEAFEKSGKSYREIMTFLGA